MAAGPALKRRRLSPAEGGLLPTALSQKASVKDFYNRAAEWDLEQDYERQPRESNTRDQERSRLPIKTADGILQHVDAPGVEQDNDSDSFLDTDTDEAAQELVEEETPKVP